MLRSWLLTAWRSAWTSRLYTLLNLAGLATGAAVTLLIALWVHDELSFNEVHEHYHRIAQVLDNQPADGGIATSDLLPIPLAAELRNRYGGDFDHIALYWPEFRHILTVGNRSIARSGSWVQKDLPVMLSFPMLQGSREALKDRSNALISQSLATALFGSADPMNRTIRVDNSVEVTVGGVFADLPANSTFHDAGIFLSLDKAVDEMAWLKGSANAWDMRGWRLYVELNEHADLARVNHNIAGLMAAHSHIATEGLFLYPMQEWHLYDKFTNGIPAGGHIGIVRLFIGIGAFVLLLACINFMNLTTARSQQRAREVGIRKVAGSRRYQLIGQFLGEAFLLTTLAILLALGIAQLCLPFFNTLSGKRLGIPWTDPLFAVAVIVLLFITTLLAGGYPAFYLSGFRPVKVLKGDLSIGSSLPRKILVILQFTVSISLVIGTTLIGRQIDFARDRPIGYSRDGLLNIGKNTSDLYQAHYNSLREDLLHTGMVNDMAESSVAATEPLEAARGVSWLGEDTTSKPSFTSVFITADYGNTIHWQLVSGRDFRRDFTTDSGKVIINESAARLMGFTQPVGKDITAYGQRLTIIGVVRDMVVTSPFQRVQPGFFQLAPDTNLNDILIRVTPSTPMRQALAAIEKIFHRYNPGSPFDFHFVDTDYALKFAAEERIDGLTRVFTILTIFISCLGLFGLAAFTAGRRAREVSIRKVLGSSVFNCWKLLTGETVRLVLLSSIIALPLAGLFMHKWLQQYEYRTPLHWWVFAAAAGGALVLALVTVSFHALKAAHTNPAKTLRSQ